MTNAKRALYTFDGTQYQSMQCANITLSDAYGTVQMKPTITIQKCP
jgi:hypothetical protein